MLNLGRQPRIARSEARPTKGVRDSHRKLSENADFNADVETGDEGRVLLR